MRRQQPLCLVFGMFLAGITTVMVPDVRGAQADELTTGMSPTTIQLHQEGVNFLAPVFPQFESGADLVVHKDDRSPKTSRFVLTPVSDNLSIINRALPLILFAGQSPGDDGQWVFFVNVGSYHPTEIVQNIPPMDQSIPVRREFNWYYSMEMSFIPKENWRVSANIALDSNEMDDALNLSSNELDPVHIGVSLAFDHPTRNKVVLDLGYGRSTLGGQLPFMLAGSPLSIQAPDSAGFSDVQVVTACLWIEF